MNPSSEQVQLRVSPSVPTKRHGDIGAARGTSSPAPPHVTRRYAERDVRLAALGYTTYGEYLQGEHWRRTRERYRRSTLPQDCVCGDDEVHLHHTTYERLGGENLTDLTPLCRRCHAMVHALEWRGLIGLDLSGLVLDEERAAQGRALLADLVASREQELREALEQQRAHLLTLPFARRLLLAVRHAKAHRRDVTSLVYILKCHVRNGRSDVILTRHLRRIEARAYGWDDWID